MPIISLPYLLGTIAVQAGSALINAKRGKKHSEELAKKQQEYEERVLKDGIENARAEFAEMCALQRELELEMQHDRLQMIRDSLKNNIMLEAYRHSLKDWPLLVPPFVIKNEYLPVLEFEEREQNHAIPVNCMMTTSSDTKFNLKIFTLLEEKLAQFFSKHWRGDKTIRFYQQAWRNNVTDIGAKMHDIKAHLSEVPTIVLSPIIDGNKLKFAFSWWGMSNKIEDEHIAEPDNVFDPELSVEVTPGMDYDEKTIEKIVDETFNKLAAFISYFADLYYWNFYKMAPLLPTLMSNEVLKSFNTNDFLNGYLNVLSSDMFKRSDKEPKSVYMFDLSGVLKFAKAIFPLLQKDTVDLFFSTLLRAICEITIVEYDKTKTYNEFVSKNNLWLFLTKEQIESIEALYSSSRELIYNDDYSELIKVEGLNKKEEINKDNSRMIMDNKVYTEKRNELVSLLSEITKLKLLPKVHRAEFERIMRKIMEDQFSVALIGEYQGGKSTTVDALCGGREISPRGNYIKTSSCRIEVSSISKDKEEYATICWKSNVEIVKTISLLLGSIDPVLLGYDESSKKRFSYEEYINLDDAQHVKLIKEAIEEKAQNLDDTDPGIKDIILIGRFIVSFYDKTKELRRYSQCSIVEASNIMTFPDKMMERYNNANGDVSVFTPQESLFAFVQTVKCYIHSKDLERLGCSVVDCPGLFASDYDTSIALDTIIHSDAVLYLLSGQKQYALGDQKAINTIYKLGKMAQPEFDGRNIFFAINQHKPVEQTTFVNLDLSMINETGFKKEKLPMYNALLYFYAQFGRNYLNGCIDQNSIDRFLSDSKKKYASVEDKWVKDISKVLLVLDLEDEYEIDALTLETVDVVNSISQSVNLFSEIEDFIVKEKAHSILIDNGAVKILGGLNAVESVLQQQEALARKDVAQRLAEYKKARIELSAFLKKSDEILSASFGDDVLREFVELVYGKYFINGSLVSSISFEITKSLLEYVKNADVRWSALKSKLGPTKGIRDKNEKKLRSEITAYFEQAFKSAYSPIIEKWVKNMYEGKDDAFNLVMLKEASKLADKMKEEWRLIVEKTPILQCLTPIESTLNLAECAKKKTQFSDEVSSEAIGKTAEMAIDDIIADIIAHVVSVVVGTVVGYVLDGLFTGGVTIIISIIISVLTFLGLRSPKEIKTPDDLGKKGRQLFDMINSNIFAAMAQGRTKNQVCYSPEGLISVASQLGESFKLYYSNQLGEKTNQLESVISEMEQQYSATRENLEKIASEAKDVRTRDLEPLRNKIQLFISKTNDVQ